MKEQLFVPPQLNQYLHKLERAAIAFSGGVDSAYLLYAAKACNIDVRAYYVKTLFQPAFELADAREIADFLHTPLTVLPLDVMQYDEITKNTAERCYYCKKMIMRQILDACGQDGYTALLDGTNASDDAGDRPGMQALRELNVLSPLRECGITKTQLREYAREAGLAVWDKPAYACLATRVATEEPIQPHTLQCVEQAENELFQLGFRDFRVRVHGGEARLQVREQDLLLAAQKHREIAMKLQPYFEQITLDLKPRESTHG